LRDHIVKELIGRFVGQRTDGSADFEAFFEKELDDEGAEVAVCSCNED